MNTVIIAKPKTDNIQYCKPDIILFTFLNR